MSSLRLTIQGRGVDGMDVKSICLAHLQFERNLTRAVIAAMADGDMDFQPTPAQMTFGGQALHLLTAWETLRGALHGQGWQWNQGLTPERFPTQADVLRKFDEVTAADLAYYGGLAPEEFGRMVETTWGPPKSLLSLLMSWSAHEAHHRGQMVTYLRLKGMTPPPY